MANDQPTVGATERPSFPLSLTACPVGPATTNSRWVKRTFVTRFLGIGATLLRELHTPGSANYDSTFPLPIKWTARQGPDHFYLAEIEAWIEARKRVATEKASRR